MVRIVKKRDDLLRSKNENQDEEKARASVRETIERVKKEGDRALFELTEKYDGVKLAAFRVNNAEIEKAWRSISTEVKNILQEAAENIRTFHEQQKKTSWFMTKSDGTLLGQKVTALDSCGVYVPGGRAAYPSSLLMGVIPAKVAGVKRVVVATPPNENGALPEAVLAAATIAGADEIYKIGGAQAVAALAYGTESIAAVDKIVGPGNIYVAQAKREVYGDVDIDSIAGPSEIVVLCDATCEPAEAAADLLSQAEHDPEARAILVTVEEQLAEAVREELQRQILSQPREAIIRASLEKHGMLYVARDWDDAVDAVNQIAPEHLELLVENPYALLGKIRHAGAVFLGRYSSEPVGDYFAGPNHILPTAGTARFSSPLSTDDFIKTSSVLSYSREAFRKSAAKIAAFARLEGLEAHARAIEAREEDAADD